MNVFHLNAIFTYLFIFWCSSVIWVVPLFPFKEAIPSSCTRWIQGFYLIIAFLVYRNIWAYKNEKYAKKCLPIAIAGYALVSIAQISACFYYASFLGAFMDPRNEAKAMLFFLIPSLPLGFFGFAISFYCNLKIRVPYIYYKRVEYFSLFPIYATLALSLSTYALYYLITSQPDVIFRHEALATHIAIVIGSILIFIGFVTFHMEVFFFAFWSLAVAGIMYLKIIGKMNGIQETDSNNLKGDYFAVVFHIITILVLIVIGMIMCLFVDDRPRLQKNLISKKHKVFILNNETLPFTVSQKC